ncbi:MAG: response regulator [Ferruginibacter sp.]
MKKILLIESNLNILENFKEYFEIEGFQIISANSGSAGIAMARECKPDLIICEIMMLGMDGYEVLRLLLDRSASHPVTHNIPFIFCTTKCEIIDRIKALKLGADDYVVKPVDMEFLNIMANSWIQSGSKRLN